MTTLVDNTIDELIRRVKASAAVSDFIFASEYPPRLAPNPVDRYLVTVGDTRVRTLRRFVGDRVSADSKGVLYEITLRLRIYAPEGSSGAALLRASSLLNDAVEIADTDKMVTDTELSCVAYDAVERTAYRDLTVTLNYLASGEVRDD